MKDFNFFHLLAVLIFSACLYACTREVCQTILARAAIEMGLTKVRAK